jgi:S1-C subfamily serine protease
MRPVVKILLVSLLICGFSHPSYGQQDISEAIVKVYTVDAEYNYDLPWQLLTQDRITGSGCIIDGKRILTNAHVVANQTFIQVKRAGEAKKYTAKVEMVSHECDLAVLRVDDDAFFFNVQPLKLGDLPRMGDKVAVYGFPQGGDELCITEGVVSRVEYQRYSHSQAYLLAGQMDAAINPGSSGGPVMKDGKIVGVAFQSLRSGDNIGYMVPVPRIQHFLKDLEDAKYDGIPSLAIQIQTMENSSLRSKYQMDATQTGVLVKYIFPGSPSENILRPGDVIFSIDGKNIANDGTIRFRENERTYFEHIVHDKFFGDTVSCRILRDGKLVDVSLKMTVPVDSLRLVPYRKYDRPPTYYVMGGLVFQPLTLNYLDTWEKLQDAPSHLVDEYKNGRRSRDRKQLVVLTKVLGDEMTAGYEGYKDHIILEVNGRRISSMEDLLNALESNEGRDHILMDDMGNQIVLEKKKIKESGRMILDKYKIGSDRSEDLMGPRLNSHLGHRY